MAGLPLGAARQHLVDSSLLTYDSIEGIEFIETTAGLPYPRSAAYKKTPEGAQMRVRDKAPDLAGAVLSEQEARAYIDALVASGLFAQRRVYRPAQGTFMLDGINWRIEVTFSGRGLKKPRPFKVEGENTFPDSYDAAVAALMALPARLETDAEHGAAAGEGDASDTPADHEPACEPDASARAGLDPGWQQA